MPRELLNKYATVLAIAGFVVSAVSGVFLFFHLGESLLIDLHAWLGLAFVLAGLGHAIRHLKPVAKHLGRPRGRWIMAGTAMLAAGFLTVAAVNDDGGHPMKRFAMSSLDAPVATLAPVVGKAPETLFEQFAEAGVTVEEPSVTLRQLAQQTGKSPMELFAVVMKPVTIINASKSTLFSASF